MAEKTPDAQDAPARGPAADLQRLLGALLLATDRPLAQSTVLDLITAAVDEEEWLHPTSSDDIAAAFGALAGERFDGRNGIELVEMAGGWRLRTATDLAPLVRRLWPDKQIRLSKAALEALSVVAYRQPCTRLDVEDIRGVDCGGVLRSLLERRLVRVVGRKDEPGRPLLYGTTPAFLELFSLPDLRSMPTLRDLADMRLEEVARQHGLVAGSDDDLPDEDDTAPAAAAATPDDDDAPA